MARTTTRRGQVTSSVTRNSSIDNGAQAGTESEVSDLASGSDKENSTRRTSSLGKRKSASRNMSTPGPSQSAASNKRRRLQEKGKDPTNQSARRKELSQKVDDSFYNPDQDENVKRRTVKGYRDLHSLLNDSRPEYLQRGSRGIQNTIKEADKLIQDVKQTSTATIDSRLLVNVGDLAYKKVTTMTLGDSSTSIDVDDFLSKCISYMKSGPPGSTQQASSRSTQQRQRQRTTRENNQESGGEDDEDSAELDWAHFGRTLCFPAINRPCVSSFLLGPLSVQKKIRQPTQRRATQRATQGNATATRPTELDEEALDRQESASLTAICSEIAGLLQRTQTRGEELVEKDVEVYEARNIEPSEEEVRQIMRHHNIAANGGVPLFNFCINPRSFGQTVENFFYVSFLIKEGRVGLDVDDDGLPTLSMVEVRSVQERQETQRNQTVFALDFNIWEELIESFGIQKSIIPHRERQDWEEDDGVIYDVSVRGGRDNNATANSSPDIGLGIGDTPAPGEEGEDMYGPG